MHIQRWALVCVFADLGCAGLVGLDDPKELRLETGAKVDTRFGADARADLGAEDTITDATTMPDGVGASDSEVALDDGTGCQVKEVVATPVGDSGTTLYTTRLSDPDPAATVARIEGDSAGNMTMVCTAAGRERLRLRFGPYTKLGAYSLAVGQLVIDGRVSDRACQVSLSSAGSSGALRGFVNCPVEPYSEGNVFAQSSLPLGLAAFDAKP